MMWWLKINSQFNTTSLCHSVGILLFLLGYGTFYGQVSIETARQLPIGSTVTVSGQVLNGQELGLIRYIYDGTAGIAIYPGFGSMAGFSNQVGLGDSIQVTGTLTLYNGLLEISPVNQFQVLSQNNPPPLPAVISLADIGLQYESQLVTIPDLMFEESGYFIENRYYTVVDQVGYESSIFIPSGSSITNQVIPFGKVHITAIISNEDGFFLLPRDTEDILPAGGLFFTEYVNQTDLSATSLTFGWSTNQVAKAVVYYEHQTGGIYTDTVTDAKIEHTYTLSGLNSASTYRIWVAAYLDNQVASGPKKWMSTTSSTPGYIEVYFNRETDPAFSEGPLPITTSGSEILDDLLSRILSAEESIDVCIYNINEPTIVNALKIAHNKGIRVRLIAAAATANTALLPPPPFPVVYGNEEGLMHHKFVVFDAKILEKAAVFMGSMNFTTQQIHTHYNNMVLVKDQALALVYTSEFEEMWGGSGSQFNSGLSRFGSDKIDDTPHLFKVGDIYLESYFSPSDNTNLHILNTLKQCDSDLFFGLLTLTKNDLADQIILNHQAGAKVRGIIENFDDTGSDYYQLVANNVPVKAHVPFEMLHHKYGVCNQSAVITGSHNWTNAANTVNDENTLIIHNPEIANIFRQEFEARWAELPGLSAIEQTVKSDLEIRYTGQIGDGLLIEVQSKQTTEGFWEIVDMQGRLIFRRQGHVHSGFQRVILDHTLTTAGIYHVVFRANHSSAGYCSIFYTP